MFAKTSKPTSSRIAFLLALVLLFALSTAALAAPLANGEFSSIRLCTLDSWSTTGTVTAEHGSDTVSIVAGTDCLAKVHAALGGGYLYTASSSLSQTFEVPTGTEVGAQNLTFNVWVRSENGISSYSTPEPFSYNSQTISIYDADNNLIYSKGRNVNMLSSQTAVFSYNLSAYAGQTVTLKIRTTASSLLLDAPSWSTIYIDSVRYAPTLIGGGGTFGW